MTQKTWSIALRLIARAQKGERPVPETANQRTVPYTFLSADEIAGPPFPVFEGIPLPTPAVQQQALSTSAQPGRVPPLGPAERERYRNMFANTGARDGLLDGEQARTIFLRARLPNETLGQVWYVKHCTMD